MGYVKGFVSFSMVWRWVLAEVIFELKFEGKWDLIFGWRVGIMGRKNYVCKGREGEVIL